MTTGRINQITTFALSRSTVQRKSLLTNSKIMLTLYESLHSVDCNMIQVV